MKIQTKPQWSVGQNLEFCIYFSWIPRNKGKNGEEKFQKTLAKIREEESTDISTKLGELQAERHKENHMF